MKIALFKSHNKGKRNVFLNKTHFAYFLKFVLFLSVLSVKNTGFAADYSWISSSCPTSGGSLFPSPTGYTGCMSTYTTTIPLGSGDTLNFYSTATNGSSASIVVTGNSGSSTINNNLYSQSRLTSFINGTVLSYSGNGTMKVNNIGSIVAYNNSSTNQLFTSSTGYTLRKLIWTNSGAGYSTGIMTLGFDNGGSLNLNGTGNHTGNIVSGRNAFTINFNSTGTVVGNISVAADGSPSMTNTSKMYIGQSAKANVTTTGTVTDIAQIQISNSSTLTTNGNYSSIATSVIVDSGSTLNISNSNTFSGAATLSNSGTININSGSTLSLTGNTSLANGSKLNVYGTYVVPTIGSLSNSGIININGSSPVITGNLSGTGFPQINIGNLSPFDTTFSYTGTISNIPNISVASVTTVTLSGAITGLNTVLSNQSTSTIIFGANVAGSATLQNNGTIFINAGTFNLTGGLENSGTMNVASTYTIPATISSNSGSFYVYGSGALSGTALTGTGSLNIGSNSLGTLYSSTSYSPNHTTAVRYVNVNAGAFNVGSSKNVTNVTTFTVASGASATFNANLTGSSSSTSNVNNYGTLTFGSGSALATFAAVNMFSNSSLLINSASSFTLALPILGTSSTTGNSLTVSGNNTNLITSSPIQYLENITIGGTNAAITTSSKISNITNLTVNNGNTLTLTTGSSGTEYGTISSIGTFTLNGDLTISSGAQFVLDGTMVGSGTGEIVNQGILTFDGADVTFPGGLDNQVSGTINIQGQPNLNFTGTSTFINNGYLIASFNDTNGLPQITTAATAPDMSHGTIVISYNNNYIAGGTYRFFTASNAVSEIDTGIGVLPSPSTYISSWDLISSYISGTGSVLEVQVTRDGFDQHALTDSAKQIGAFLEEIGSSGTTSPDLINLLNSLELITNDAELTAALDELLPPQNTTLANIQNIDAILGVVDLRLAKIHLGLPFGDEINAEKYGFWVRPFTATGKQQTNGELQAYSDSSNGYVIGLDRGISDKFLLGVAGSYTRTTINQTNSPGTTTRVNSYDVTFYGTYEPSSNTYIDMLISGGVSNYHGTRNLNIPTFTGVGTANYSNQQFTMKAMASRLYPYDIWQFTPAVMAQYSFIRQAQYTESGLGPYNVFTDPDNVNLFRLGAGAMLGVPFSTRDIVSIPSIYAMVYADAKGGAVTTNSMFVVGGPIIVNTVQQSRMMLKLGATYELKLNNNFEVVFNYDYLVRQGFQGQEGFINLRYIF